MAENKDMSVKATPTPTPSRKTNVPGMEKYVGQGYNGAELKVLMYFDRPEIKALMKKYGFELVDVREQKEGLGMIKVSLRDSTSGVNGLKREWDFQMEDYFLLGNTKEAIVENLEARVNLKKALKDEKIAGLLKLYKVDPNNITLIHYGTNTLGRATSVMNKVVYGGKDKSEYSIYLNATLSADQMVERLEEEIPKFARAVEKAEKDRQAKIKHDLKY